MYRDRLVRAYLGASNSARRASRFTGFAANDDIAMHALDPAAEAVSRGEPRPEPGRREQARVAAAQGGVLHRHRPALRQPRPGLPNLVRLRRRHHPRHRSRDLRRRGEPEHGISLVVGGRLHHDAVQRAAGFVARQSRAARRAARGATPVRSRRCARWSRKRSVRPRTGASTSTCPTVVTSRTSGLYEMVRRRCRFIVVVDGGCDPDFHYDDLGNALRKIRIDLRIPIDFDDEQRMRPIGQPQAALRGRHASDTRSSTVPAPTDGWSTSSRCCAATRAPTCPATRRPTGPSRTRGRGISGSTSHRPKATVRWGCTPWMRCARVARRQHRRSLPSPREASQLTAHPGARGSRPLYRNEQLSSFHVSDSSNQLRIGVGCFGSRMALAASSLISNPSAATISPFRPVSGRARTSEPRLLLKTDIQGTPAITALYCALTQSQGAGVERRIVRQHDVKLPVRQTVEPPSPVIACNCTETNENRRGPGGASGRSAVTNAFGTGRPAPSTTRPTMAGVAGFARPWPAPSPPRCSRATAAGPTSEIRTTAVAISARSMRDRNIGVAGGSTTFTRRQPAARPDCGCAAASCPQLGATSGRTRCEWKAGERRYPLFAHGTVARDALVPKRSDE